MKNVRLFPKTFLYVFSLMAAVVLVSHALFYFMMPAAYTWQKETALKKTQTLLIEELRESLNSSSVLHDEITDAFRSYAIQNQMGVFVYYEGKTYIHMADSLLSEGSDAALQGEYESGWSIRSEDINADSPGQNFYIKTDSQLYSGVGFETADGKFCYLILLSTLQPVSEAKDIAVIFLPFTLLLSLGLSGVFALLYSKKITKPLSAISETTGRMKELDRSAVCRVNGRDEIGVLSENINQLYNSLLSTIDELQKENVRVTEAEGAKVDFLRAASHELKTPVTGLCALLDNMIMGIGRYRDWETYLPVCRNMAERFAVMIQEILDASKLNFSFEARPSREFRIGPFMERLLAPYLLIAKSKGVTIRLDFTDDFLVCLPEDALEKALSNIISNAVKYTETQCEAAVYFENRSVVVENECQPVSQEDLLHIFEPFYRPDFSRSRNAEGENPNGGNGLGLYIAAKILTALECRFSFRPFGGPGEGKKRGMRFTVFL